MYSLTPKKILALVALMLLGVGIFHGVDDHHDELGCDVCILLPALVLSILGLLYFVPEAARRPVPSSTTFAPSSVLSRRKPVRGPPRPIQFSN